MFDMLQPIIIRSQSSSKELFHSFSRITITQHVAANISYPQLVGAGILNVTEHFLQLPANIDELEEPLPLGVDHGALGRRTEANNLVKPLLEVVTLNNGVPPGQEISSLVREVKVGDDDIQPGFRILGALDFPHHLQNLPQALPQLKEAYSEE